MNLLSYKGYTGQLEFDLESNLLHGRVLDIKDVVTFEGETIEAAKRAFEESIDDYLDFCAELGEEPDKPFAGKLLFRTTPEHHRLIYLATTKAGKSINAWMDETLTHSAQQLIGSD